ncbi:MAG: pitrilysin family protein [Alphaproteobacteria bacterium]|nr:pitrilysin family protein [Alphaproteobacteria bacterium]
MSVKISQLDHGLQVVTDPMEGVESTALGLWFKVGARYETAKLSGMAHFIEHMLFKGTDRRSSFSISEEIEATGGYLNAYTSRENTAFYARMLAQDTELCLDVLADVLQHSRFEPEDIEREQTVISQEIAQAEDTPDDVVFTDFQSQAFAGQGLGQSVLGSQQTLSNINRENAMAFWQYHYRPDKAILVASGGVDHDAFVRLAERLFWPDRGERGPREMPTAAKYTGGVTLKTRALEQVHTVLGFEGASMTDPRYFASAVLSTLLGGGSSSRLFQEIREKRGLAYHVGAHTSGYADTGLFAVYAGTAPEAEAELLSVLIDEFKRLVDTNVPELEIERARAQIRASVLMGRESTSSRAEDAAQQMLVYGIPRTVSDLIGQLDAVDAAAIRREAELMLSSPVTLSAIGPLSDTDTLYDINQRLA